MTIKTQVNVPFRIENPLKGLTVVQVGPGQTVPPHSHAEGYVVVPFMPALVERTTHGNGKEIKREPINMLPFVPYYVEATKPGETISLTNNGRSFSTFQKFIPDSPITGPQPELPLGQATIVGQGGTRNLFTVEMAVTLIEQAVGLMFRPTLAADRGMLFVWSAPREVAMYMRNTLVPLDMLFVDENFVISRIHANAKPGGTTPILSQGNVMFTLEIPGGTAAALGIQVGDTLE